MGLVGTTSAALIAPREIPVPPSAPAAYLSAWVETSSDSWTVDLYVTPQPLAPGSPQLSDPPYGPGGPNYLGSFGDTLYAGAEPADATVQADASGLDSSCRGALVDLALAPGVDGQSCPNGTGTTYLWSQGVWHVAVVATNPSGPADTGLLQRLLAYLHTATLPAPASIGVIRATAVGGSTVSTGVSSSTVPYSAHTAVKVEWTSASGVVHVDDALDAIEGLQMAVSEVAY